MLKFLALGVYGGFGVSMRCSWGLAEMPVHVSAMERTREEDRAITPWGVHSQLAKGEDLAPALRMQLWAQSSHLQFGHILDTHTIDYSPHDHSCFACPAWKLHLLYHLEKGPRWTAGAVHKQSLRYNLTENGGAWSGQKPVQLDQQPLIDILTLGLLAMNLLVLVMVDVNPYDGTSSVRSGKHLKTVTHYIRKDPISKEGPILRLR